MEIKITKTTAPKQKPDEHNLPFGTYMTDHMFVMHYDTDQGGWHDPEIKPYGPIELLPACPLTAAKALLAKVKSIMLARHKTASILFIFSPL